MVSWRPDAIALVASTASSRQVDALLLLVCATFAFAVVVGVPFFYGGMSGRAGAIAAFRAAVSGAAVVVLLALVGGYGMMVGPALIPGVVGRPDWGLGSALAKSAGDPYPLAQAAYLIVLSAVAVAILGAAVASRVTLRAWMVFVALWSVLVLFPAFFAVFALNDGWAVAGLRVIDFGGALPVSLAAGSAAAGVILACGRRSHPPAGTQSLPLSSIGGALVWFGWFGITVGSEGAVDAYTGLIWINTLVASAGGVLAWVVVDRVMLRRPTITSALCGAVSGLVAITPGSGVVAPGWALILGVLAALACASMVDVAARARFGVPMMIGVVHIVASLVGLLFVGLFATGGGMIDSGNFDLFVGQAIAGFGVALYSFAVSSGIALALRFSIGLARVGYGADRGITDEISARSGRRVPSEHEEPHTAVDGADGAPTGPVTGTERPGGDGRG
ncbi:ammonium transporter [Leifsonia sp. NPDC058292]|uniref:ammonium transporter n=1 Tax=Leifsonia sp. NPDC058292 TaxID=3346428 RepID=UPI0036DE601E